MKLICKIAFAFLLALTAIFSVYAQAPCLKIEGDTWTSTCPPTNQTSPQPVSGTIVNYSLLQPNEGIESTDPKARYKAFWIFGDGTFRYYADTSLESDIRSQSQTHTYSKTVRYQPMVVLTEKKSNTTPPQGPKRSISINTAQATPDWIPQITLPSESMNIFPSGFNRPHYYTAFVVSARKSDTQISGIYFFYNRVGDGVTYAPGDLHDNLDPWALLPDYLTGAGIVNSTTDNLGSTNPGFLPEFLSLRNHYKNFIYVPVTPGAFGNIPGTFDELRIFPVLNTMWQDAWGTATPLPKGKYLAVAVGASPHDPASLPPYWGQLQSQTQGEIASTINASTLLITSPGSAQPRFVRGIATIDLEMTGAIDPNDLVVTKICPDGQGQYEVTFRLKVCNEGYLEAVNFDLFLKDNTGGLLSKPIFTDPTITLVSTDTDPNNDGDWDYTWNITLDGVPLPVKKGNTEPKPVNTCTEDTYFTVTTTWEGVQKLIEGKGLQLCVFFNQAPDECTYNAPLEVDNPALIQTEGYNARECQKRPEETTPPDSTDCDCCRPQYTTVIIIQVTILIFVLLIVWMIARKMYPEFFDWFKRFGKRS
ncbi:MAG: hypothetical protein IPK76_24810 [Lewinellaceae bacterium]|jgi:hypothetical protein|nr:hypothetical protein [Lewinellaceae bacterium]